MIAVAIVGILASLAIPMFAKYKRNAYAAEAFTHVGAMFTGVRAYYGMEHWGAGVASAGANTGAAACTPQTSVTSNSPASDTKHVLDWDAQHPGFDAVGFTPPEALLFHYRMGATGLTPAGTQPGVFWPGSGGDCGHTANDIRLYDLEASHLLPNGSYFFMRWHICTNQDNIPYVCRRVASEVCTLRPGARGSPNVGALLALIGISLVRRRSRHGA